MHYKCESRICDLCLSEKVGIAWLEEVGLLNKWFELLYKCWHRNKFIVTNLK